MRRRRRSCCCRNPEHRVGKPGSCPAAVVLEAHRAAVVGSSCEGGGPTAANSEPNSETLRCLRFLSANIRLQHITSQQQQNTGRQAGLDRARTPEAHEAENVCLQPSAQLCSLVPKDPRSPETSTPKTHRPQTPSLRRCACVCVSVLIQQRAHSFQSKRHEVPSRDC